ncbi:MAG: PadR family transcriptional regulator [Oscillospiraceae bacterium]|jgi:PadR family transcriptional regulator PadR|nr:PadR family transcriptional regulator [Oscillospiraceae bacterium]
MAIQASGTLLDMSVLAMLAREDLYGYLLTQNATTLLGVSESTVYPIMRRLQTEECLDVYDVPYSGRNRRYYSITESGRRRLREYTAQWQDFKETIDNILGGAENDGE